MGLDIFFVEDIHAHLTALRQANERAMMLAVTYGMSAEAAHLYGQVYHGALDDVAAGFGLSLAEPSPAALSAPVQAKGAWIHG